MSHGLESQCPESLAPGYARPCRLEPHRATGRPQQVLHRLRRLSRQRALESLGERIDAKYRDRLPRVTTDANGVSGACVRGPPAGPAAR